MRKILLTLLFVLGIGIQAQQDCSSALGICGNTNINYSPIGYGNDYETLGGCLASGGENNTVWYKFTIATSGTLTFVITPSAAVDYDWAVYGPNVNCTNRGTPIRCNAAGTFGTTGLNMTSTNTVGAPGSNVPFCRYMDVVAGETYFFVIDNWVGAGSTTTAPFSLVWGGTATLADPFTNSSLAPNSFNSPGVPATTSGNPSEVYICANNASFDFTTLNSQIFNGNQNFSVSYHNTINDALSGSNPLTSPYNVDTSTTYYYSLYYQNPNDPANSSANCRKIGSFKFVNKSVNAIIAASSPTACFGNSITLTSNYTTGNTWSNGATTQSITITSSGTYTLTNTNGICTSTASKTIEIFADPNLQVNGSLTFCQNSSTILTATTNGNGNTYSWSNGSTTASTTITTPGNYTVNLTTSDGCQFSKTITVTQNPITAQNASINKCSGTTSAVFDLTSVQSQINLNPGVTFTYYQNQADAVAANSSNITNPTSYTSGNATIYVLVQQGNCKAIAELQLTVQQAINPIITASSTNICYGGSVTLTSNLTTGNTWSNGATTQSITVTSAGNYTLTNNVNGCTTTPASINITQEGNPNLQITGNTNICSGTSTTLTATANGTGYTYSWSNGSSTANTTINSAGTYIVTATSANGCQYTKSVTVNIETPITINIVTPSPITCTNTQVNLNASGSTYPSGSTFQWTTTGGNIVSGSNTHSPTVNQGGTYTLTITSSLGCTKSSTVTVTKDSDRPTITLTSTKIKICQGDQVTLTASGASTYNWSNLPGNTGTQTISPNSTTTYSVSGVGSNGCTSSNTATITIEVIPNITSTLADKETCPGDSITLDAGNNLNYTYSWNTGATTSSIDVATSGSYSVTINNGTCTRTFTANVIYTKSPEIKEIIYKNNSLTIIAINHGSTPLEYSIDGGTTWQTSPTFDYVFRNTLYHIRVKNSRASCVSSAQFFTHFIPNTITPNHDGINDKIDFTNIALQEKFNGIIVDRFGTTVFKLTPKNTIWEGTYNGRPLQTETYWYHLSWVDEISGALVNYSGWILVKNRD